MAWDSSRNSTSRCCSRRKCLSDPYKVAPQERRELFYDPLILLAVLAI